jgi:hypothetical protein
MNHDTQLGFSEDVGNLPETSNQASDPHGFTLRLKNRGSDIKGLDSNRHLWLSGAAHFPHRNIS